MPTRLPRLPDLDTAPHAQVPRYLWLLIGAAFVIPIGAIDIASGPYYPLSVLNLIPVVLIAWCGGRLPGMAAAFQAGVLALTDAYQRLPHDLSTMAMAWNLGSDAVTFLVMAELGARLRSGYMRQAAMATMDPLTELLNRRGFRQQAAAEIARAARSQSSMTAVYFDCDNFKTVNDQLGHAEGDKLLHAIGEALRFNLRPEDACGRLGGDEFAILMPGCAGERAAACVERIRRAMLKVMAEHHWPVTFSIGAASFDTTPASVDALLARVDALQYQAKQAGKDQVRADFGPMLRLLSEAA